MNVTEAFRQILDSESMITYRNAWLKDSEGKRLTDPSKAYVSLSYGAKRAVVRIDPRAGWKEDDVLSINDFLSLEFTDIVADDWHVRRR